MYTADYTITLRNVGREISDADWEIIDADHISAWKEAQCLYKSIKVNDKSNDICLSFDFSEAINDLQHRYKVMQRLIIDGDQSAINDFRFAEVNITCKASSKSESVSNQFSSATKYAEYFVYEIFLVMNIAAPGSCDFDAAFMNRNSVNLNVYGKQITYDILLSNRTFELAIYEKDNCPWLSLSFISVTQILNWLHRACPRFSMVSDTPVAKCVYSLFYLASSDYSPASVSWVFYALESLFQCKPGENFNVLANRISCLLSLKEEEKTQLRKNLRKLYDVRSSFVHGGAEIAHPMRDESLDQRVEETAWRNVPLTNFGVALILRCLQELIRRDAVEIAFEENLRLK